MNVAVTVTVNGKTYQSEVEPRLLLVHYLRDVLGRETVIVQPFFTHASLLEEGLSDWSLEAGATRRNLGLDNANYGEGFASGIWRRGISNEFTLEGRGEVARRRSSAGHASHGRRATATNRPTVSATLTSCPKYSAPRAAPGVRAGRSALSVMYKLAMVPIAAPASAEAPAGPPHSTRHTAAMRTPIPACQARIRTAVGRMSLAPSGGRVATSQGSRRQKARDYRVLVCMASTNAAVFRRILSMPRVDSTY